MKKKSNKMKINIFLGKDFKNLLNSEIEDEFIIAQKKWSVQLSVEDKDRIKEFSLEQLYGKEEFILGSKESNNNVTVIVESYEEKQISISENKFPDGKLSLLRHRDCYEIDYDNLIDSIPIKKFAQHIKKEIFKWVRTAIFYGVGSYADNDGGIA